ncbi:hypothetical protein ACIA8C_09240 [Nocardia sp. NPDC051321]|uniref:hypothetical protein n=1 Tax=Nocardia sp. NPDC051321 TaxID=3364323 RepID=UPI0037910B89
MTASLTTFRKVAFAMVTIAAAFFAVSAGASVASASGVYTEIKFAPNTDHGTVTGYINRGYTDVWVLDARAGQQMTTDLISHYTSASGTARFDIAAPDGQVICRDNTWSQLRLPQTGKYHVTLTSPQDDASYTMNVEII